MDNIEGVTVPRVMAVGEVFDPSNHYGPEYYGGGAGILFPSENGGQRLYHGPSRTWDGFEKVINAIDTSVHRGHGRKLVDLGCSSGDFIGRTLKRGWDAYGVDLSAAASSESPEEVRQRIIIQDITKPGGELGQKAPFDLCTTWDFWEHIFTDDLGALTDSVWRLLRPYGLMVNDICTAHATSAEFIADKGCTISHQNGVFLCSGHVNVRTWGWWREHFESRGFRVRNDIAYEMQVSLTEQDLFERSWSPRNLLVLERLP